MEHPLAPSLWRTCRVLANRRRLALFRAMLDHRPQTVSELAERCALPPTICSQYLRLLQARGLCRAIRDGRWVLYELHADPSVADSALILRALKIDMSTSCVEFDTLIGIATACTHPRRVMLLAILGREWPLSVDDLRYRSGISHAALFRHLDKLVRRKFIRWHDGVVGLDTPSGAFGAVLLATASGKPV